MDTTAEQVRPAERSELAALARLWHDAWRDAHLGLVPEALARLRTLEQFEARLEAALADVRVMGPPGAPLGFSLTRGDELYQLFVAAAARGSGVALSLIADAERRIAGGGASVAWLTCAIGNQRARRFYEKCGWRLTGTFVDRLQTTEGVFPLEVWRFEKPLA